jgi:serine O-acetyltransferase
MILFFEDLKHKMSCYQRGFSTRNLLKILRSDGTSAMLLYRVSQPLVKYRLGPAASFLRALNRIINGCWIGRNADFGPGFVIMHPSGVVINSGVKGGKNIVVQSGVVIGVARDECPFEIPSLGNNIFIGAGAKLLGDVRIGNNVIIGANAVIVHDVPDNATVVGIPGKIIKIGSQPVAPAADSRQFTPTLS